MGQGSTGNVLAAICSFFIPGLGQLVQGRFLRAVGFFLGAGVFYAIGVGFFPLLLIGVAIQIWSIFDAATFKS